MHLPKISVRIITYNQENLIGRAIDSLLRQKEFIYEIIISDDCSTDRTWLVIQDYFKKYPKLIKPYRNSKNLGIFGNIESGWDKITGDLIFDLSGDDEFCDGLFERTLSCLAMQNINFQNDAFAVYCDFKEIRPNGKTIIFTNRMLKKDIDPISLKIRGLIVNRTVGYSRTILESLKPVDKNIGIYADGLLDMQIQQYAKKNYYFSFVGSIYYAGIGISSVTQRKEHINSIILFREKQKKAIENISKEDAQWLDYVICYNKLLLNPSIKLYLRYTLLLIQILKIKYGLRFVIREIKKYSKYHYNFIKRIFLQKK